MKQEAEGSKTAWTPKRELDYQYKHCGDNNAVNSYETTHRSFLKSVLKLTDLMDSFGKVT